MCYSDLRERQRGLHGRLFDDADAVHAPAASEIVMARLRPRKGSSWASHDKQRTSQRERQEEGERGQLEGQQDRRRGRPITILFDRHEYYVFFSVFGSVSSRDDRERRRSRYHPGSRAPDRDAENTDAWAFEEPGASSPRRGQLIAFDCRVAMLKRSRVW